MTMNNIGLKSSSIIVRQPRSGLNINSPEQRSGLLVIPLIFRTLEGFSIVKTMSLC